MKQPVPFLHSPAFHGVVVVLASLASFAIAWLADALHAGTIQLSPGLLLYSPLLVGLLTILGVALRDWLEGQRRPATPPTPPEAPR